MDFLIQRYLPATANEAHKASGSWEDVALLRDIPVEDAKQAVRDELAKFEPLRGPQPDRIRAIKFDHIAEFDAARGKPELADQPSAIRGT